MVNTKKIKELMEEKKITGREMAAKTGVGESMMSYILSGLREPNVKTLVLIAQTLGCTVDELIRAV